MEDQNDYYNDKSIKRSASFELTFICLISLFILAIFANSFSFVETICFLTMLWGLYFIHKEYKHSPKHQIKSILDSYDSIQIFNLDNKFIALVYRDHTIEYYGEVTIYQKIKIKEISNYFDEHFKELTDAEK